MLWIALHLPLLSLESFAATLLGNFSSSGPQPPLALMDAHRVLCANSAALALGVKPGLKRATALALAPHLVLGRADPTRDAQAIAAVAHAALAFTPCVTLQAPDGAGVAPHTVLLEVQSSLRYFGGLERLLQRLQASIEPLNHCVHVVSAPTAQGAALLARVHVQRHCADAAVAKRALAAVPLAFFNASQEHAEALQSMGLRTWSDLQVLPRAGLARRFGAALLNEWDRAVGAQPDPRIFISLPPVFESRLELFARADTTEQVLQGAQLLVARLVVWLSAQHAFVRRFILTLHHETRRLSDPLSARCTTMEIALASPTRDSARLLLLLKERLAHLHLPAPTLDVGLQADDIVKRAAPNQELFPTPRHEREGLTQLIERLQARLGAQQIQRLQRVEDHRPECSHRLEPLAEGTVLRGLDAKPVRLPQSKAASAKKRGPSKLFLNTEEVSTASDPVDAQGFIAVQSTAFALSPEKSMQGGGPSSAPKRPVWLLPEPQPLPERQSRPVLDGKPLQLLSGPDRIEAGWWDAALAERDYFIAQTSDGALVWIYRARLPLSAPEGAQGWFMQGRFG